MKITAEFKYRNSNFFAVGEYLIRENQFSDISFYGYRKGNLVEVPRYISDKFDDFTVVDALFGEVRNDH